MPPRNPPRALASEGNLARRVAFERERLGMTYDGLAKRVTEAGCPIQGSAIYKIERGDPPRRITVDELIGFSRVFDIAPEDLLVPTEVVADRALMDAMDDLAKAQLDLEAAIRRRDEVEKDVRARLKKLGVELGDVSSGSADGHGFMTASLSGRTGGGSRGKRRKKA